jgi:hypothetical protein
MKHYASELGIRLLFIPPGLTDEFQPLDRFVFGVMKANCRRMYRVHTAAEGVMTKQTAAGFLVRAWEAVSSQVLDDAWSIYEESDMVED